MWPGARGGRKTNLALCNTRSSLVVSTFVIALALGSCGAPSESLTDVAAIGGALRLVDPDRVALGVNERRLAEATTMGLVTLDASGQVEPGLAESWIVTDDGLSTIFRIRRMRWPDGTEVTGDHVAASLNRALARNSRNTLKPLLSAIDKVIGMTGRVVEVRLKVPRPNLLQLLAQPELGIRRKGAGLGPWRARPDGNAAVMLTPYLEPELERYDKREAPRVQLRATSAALAIARFDSGRSALVLGGTLADWPVAQAARIRANRIRIDPADGLFGFGIVGRSDFLREASLRDALSMAIDRDAFAPLFGIPRWRVANGLLPARLDSAALPALPAWSTTAIERRRAIAAGRVRVFTSVRGPIAPLRIAVPGGPGMRLFFAQPAADWRAIGVAVVAVSHTARDADLRLIDEVAPNASANWYLTRTGCDFGLPCSPESAFALRESRAAPNLAARAFQIGKADAAQVDAAAFIPIARPVRWSLVAPQLDGYRDNAFAVHPLDQLRIARR